MTEWWPCCSCCDDPLAEGGPMSACYFNGERDRHTWHCETAHAGQPVMYDLFCGGGGAGEGYHRAGFKVIGFDIKPQPNYPFEFVQADAMEMLLDTEAFGLMDVEGGAAIHASPPCQAYSTTRTLHTAEYPKLIEPVRELLQAAGVPYVIENVPGAPLINPIKLCGSTFGLGVRRHRLFEISGFTTDMPVGCRHDLQPEPVDVTGTGARRLGPRLDGKGGNSRKPYNLAHAREVMGIDWMTRRELSEAVPPAYTEWIGQQLYRYLTGEVAA